MPQLILQYHEILVLAGLFLVWSIARPYIDAKVKQFALKKQDIEFLTYKRFLEVCGERQSNCMVLKDFTRKMDGLTEAMKVLIVHTVTDKDTQEETLRLLK